MKKVYQFIAAAVFSAATTGAIAQIPANMHIASRATLHAVSSAPKHVSKDNVNKVEGGVVNARVDYVNGDETWNNTAIFYRWNPACYMNMHYTAADTITSPYTSASANVNTTNYCTVTFDTLWDVWEGNFAALYPKAGSMAVDSIFAYMEYFNSSGMNDTVVFQVTAVSAKGFPAATIYGVDTVILTPSSLAYNSVDSVQFVQIIPTTPIMIPASARHGWNFAINMQVLCNKADTIGVWYFSQGIICSPNAITSAYTSMGVVDGHAPCVNSWTTGNYWFAAVTNHGNGKQMTWPTYTGSYPGYCINSGLYYWYDNTAVCSPDTGYYPFQDIGISASVMYLDPTGVNEVSNKDFSIGQNYPNPFTNQTTINYNLTKASDVVFTVHDMTGREIFNNNMSTVAPGQHVMTINANQFSPGVYFYTFNVNGVNVTRKMVITQ